MKKVIFYIMSKISIIIPIILIYEMYYDPIPFYINRINFIATSHMVFGTYIAINILWQALLPRKYFCSGDIYEILFNMLPTGIFLLILFQQHHFYITCLLEIACAYSFLSTRIAIKRQSKRDPRKYKKQKYQSYRCVLIEVSLICLVPGFLMVFIYELRPPQYVPQDTEVVAENTVTDSEIKDPFEEYKNYLQEFSEDSWKNKRLQEKIDLSQKFVDFEAKRLGIDTVPISAEKMNITAIIASYSFDNDCITIDTRYLQDLSATEYMSTLCEECYHALEDCLLTNVDWNDDILNTKYFEELRNWAENTYHYQDGWDYEAYENQPLEASAKRYAREEVDEIEKKLVEWGKGKAEWSNE